MTGADEKINLGKNKHLGTFDEGIQFVLWKIVKFIALNLKLLSYHAHFQMMNIEFRVVALQNCVNRSKV